MEKFLMVICCSMFVGYLGCGFAYGLVKTCFSNNNHNDPPINKSINQTTYSIHSKGEPAYAEFIDPQTGVHYLRNENNILIPRYNKNGSIMTDK